MDIAKALLDYGIHPPTMYFPLIVHEALMVEPTETESPENLEELKRVLNNPDSQGIMHYKYIPRTGGGFTQADAEYVCLNPKAAKLPDDVRSIRRIS